jgi:hypothetical protein
LSKKTSKGQPPKVDAVLFHFGYDLQKPHLRGFWDVDRGKESLDTPRLPGILPVPDQVVRIVIFTLIEE